MYGPFAGGNFESLPAASGRNIRKKVRGRLLPRGG